MEPGEEPAQPESAGPPGASASPESPRRPDGDEARPPPQAEEHASAEDGGPQPEPSGPPRSLSPQHEDVMEDVGEDDFAPSLHDEMDDSAEDAEDLFHDFVPAHDLPVPEDDPMPAHEQPVPDAPELVEASSGSTAPPTYTARAAKRAKPSGDAPAAAQRSVKARTQEEKGLIAQYMEVEKVWN